MRAIKEKLKKLPIIKDYLSFLTIYHEESSLIKFLKFRYMLPFTYNKVYWPVHKFSEVRGRVFIGKGARVGHRPNCIIQGRGKVFIGDYVEIGPNSVIISGNHSLTNQSDVVRKETIIGDNCWIASSCVILAGVVLGPRTVVGAGSVVTKSFPEGYCVIAGNPAKIVKQIPKEDFVLNKPIVEYYGYIRADKFRKYYRRFLPDLMFTYDIKRISNNELFANEQYCNILSV